MPAFVPQRYEQILQRMISKVVARTSLSDITDASVTKHLLAAPAREIDEAYFQMTNLQSIFSLDTAQGEDLDQRAKEILPGIITRRQSAKAVGLVAFARTGTSGTVAIPIGTKTKTAGGVEFVTTVAGTILDTFSASGDVAAVAVLAGLSGNVDDSTIVKFDSKPVGVDTVTNNANFTQGEDVETDDDFRNRIRDFIASLARCTPEALEFVAEQVAIDNGQRVKFAHLVEDLVVRGESILYIDDGAGTAETTAVIVGENITEGLGGPPPDSAVGGEDFLPLDQRPVKSSQPFTISSSTRGALVQGTDYTLEDASGQIKWTPVLATAEVLTGGYTHYTGLIQEVQKVIDGDPLDRVNYPGWRAAGTRVRVRTPSVLIQEVTAILSILEGFADSEVFSNVEDVILDLINNLGISGDLLRARLIERIMSVSGVFNVDIIEPASDVVILDDQLPRTDIANITLS